ncbi:hypothetical protein ACLK1T_14515 [Escherichia coli]
MAWLAVVVSQKVDGLLELHSNLMVQSSLCRLCEKYSRVVSPTSPTV